MAATPPPIAPAAPRLLCVYSTLTAPVRYTDWKGNNGVAVEGDSVLIKGGAGVANANLITPDGVPTMVTGAQAELLKRNAVFKLHERNGFVKLVTLSVPPDGSTVEKAVADMERRDGSAPLVEADFTANGMKAPSAATVDSSTSAS